MVARTGEATAFVRLYQNDGTPAWETSIDPFAAARVVVTPSGDVVIAARFDGTGAIVVRKLAAANGNLVWETKVEEKYPYVRRLAAAPNGGVILSASEGDLPPYRLFSFAP